MRILLDVGHAAGNLRVVRGTGDIDVYGYFYARLCWAGFGLPADIAEEYFLRSALFPDFVGLVQTWDVKLASLLKMPHGATCTLPRRA